MIKKWTLLQVLFCSKKQKNFGNKVITVVLNLLGLKFQEIFVLWSIVLVTDLFRVFLLINSCFLCFFWYIFNFHKVLSPGEIVSKSRWLRNTALEQTIRIAYTVLHLGNNIFRQWQTVSLAYTVANTIVFDRPTGRQQQQTYSDGRPLRGDDHQHRGRELVECPVIVITDDVNVINDIVKTEIVFLTAQLLFQIIGCPQSDSFNHSSKQFSLIK